MTLVTRFATGLVVLGFAFALPEALLAGCAAETAAGGGEFNDASADGDANLPLPVTNREAVARAMEWSDAKLAYCWAPNGGDNHEAGNFACERICERQRHPEWDPYRSDCSGLVSWAWKLPAPGRITTDFFPFKADVTFGIDANDLRPGDAINNETHVMLFKKWVIPGERAVFIEEPGCGTPEPYAHETTSDVTISGRWITPKGRSQFRAIRYKYMESDPR